MNTLPALKQTEVKQTLEGVMAAPAGEARGGGVPEEPRVGRPSGCTPEAVGLLCSVIREFGLTDSAAARRLGMGASTLSRWKREDPEVRTRLQQAREECRAVQLQNIMHAAAAEHGRGWRAAAWLLERLFPEDYAPQAGAREGHRSVAEARDRREDEAAVAEERWQKAWEAAQPPERAGAEVLAQEGDCRNGLNSVGKSMVAGESAEEPRAVQPRGVAAPALDGSDSVGGQAFSLTRPAGFQPAETDAAVQRAGRQADADLAEFCRQLDARFA